MHIVYIAYHWLLGSTSFLMTGCANANHAGLIPIEQLESKSTQILLPSPIFLVPQSQSVNWPNSPIKSAIVRKQGDGDASIWSIDQ